MLVSIICKPSPVFLSCYSSVVTQPITIVASLWTDFATVIPSQPCQIQHLASVLTPKLMSWLWRIWTQNADSRAGLNKQKQTFICMRQQIQKADENRKHMRGKTLRQTNRTPRQRAKENLGLKYKWGIQGKRTQVRKTRHRWTESTNEKEGTQN